MSATEIIVAPRTKAEIEAAISRKVRPWQVVHACDYARDIADVIEAQVDAGMRPYLLTVGADLAAKPSVFQAWQDVRRWRKALDESGAHTSPELIHAHSFAAGMAAVRLGACVVYDLRITIETRLAASDQTPGAWMARSFRTAEQFVLSRACAVVTHDAASREDCISRGITAEDVFVVPDPLLVDSGDLVFMSPEDRALARDVRSPLRIADMYDHVYRYAHAQRRKKGDPADSSGALIPIQANY